VTQILVVARRELGAMFRAPLAYVFLVLFLFITQLFPMLAVFAQGQAELRLFFDILPWCIVVFAALVTMRSWAEERQDNTYEMLLTFPMRDRHLVLAKWIASFAFLSLGILGTLGLPIMMFSIGSPDRGPIIAGYLGAFALAAASSAAGVFFSGLTRSQLLAALMSLVAGLVSLVVGTDTVSTLGDARVGGLGSLAHSTLGAWNHYAVFERGVVEMNDVLFFVAWTVVFLHLNTLFLGLRRMADSWPRMLGATALGLGCGMLASRLVSEGSLSRFDLTQDKLYTLSPGTLAILAQAQVPVQVKYYVSPESDMPSQYKAMEREVVDHLNEMQVASHGKLRFSVLHMHIENLVVTPEEEAATDDEGEPLALGGDDKTKKPDEAKKKVDEAKKRAAEKEKSVERRMLDKGLKPFTVESVEATQVSSKLVYSSLGVAYREKDEELIPLDQKRLPEMEYLLANVVAKIARPRPPKVALVVGEENVDPQMRRMMQQMGQKIPEPYSHLDDLLRQEKYDVQTVKLTPQSQLPEDYDALVVVGAANLDDRQKWEIGRALQEGRPTLLALQRYTWEYRQQRQQILIQHQDAEFGLDDLLAANGLGVAREYLMDANKRPLMVQTGGFFPQTIDVPMHVLVAKGQMNAESPLTQRLSSILYLWGTSLALDDKKIAENDLKKTILLSSSDKSWLVPAGRITSSDFSPEGKDLKPRPLAVMVEGQFKNPEGEKPRPKWTPHVEMDPMSGRPIPSMPDKPESPAAPAKGKLILVGCARMWSDALLGAMGDGVFFLNCVDALTLDENLLLVRSKQPTDRSFDKPSEITVKLWTATMLILVPLLVVVIGVLISVLRFRRRESWNAAHGRWRP